MRAVVFEKGVPEELAIQEVPDPTPGPGEVLVRTKASALNRQEVLGTFDPEGKWRWRFGGGKRILGSDSAGVVELLGPEVSGVSLGERVVVNPNLSCGGCPACLSGRDNECSHYGVVGRDADGGYGELMRVPAANLVPIPENLSFEQAAAIPVGFVTAWGMVQRAQLQPGERVLVTAAGSGVGSAAIQVAKLFNTWVVTTASTEAKRRQGAQLGADAAVDYTQSGWTDDVLRLTQHQGIDAVLDCVGGKVLVESLDTLVMGGCAVLSGYAGGTEINLDYLATSLGRRSITICFSRMGSKALLPKMMKFFETGQLRPVVHEVFPFSQLREAHEMLLRREQFGKIVVAWD